ncbi:MAG: universal stress protein, partial [Gammaproteobacteria bacterium]|nr:universal stress protein [Gammaproteobacteria bacterium]
TTNTDWELARRSPANLWLVSDSTRYIDRVVAAIGNKLGDPSDVTTAADYDLLRAAGLLQDIYDAEIYPVNAYQPPMTHTFVSSIGATPVAATAGTDEKVQVEAVKRHFGAVRALARYCNIPRENVHVLEGHPSDVIPRIVDELKANLIVMGARSFGRLERFVSSVTVEPVMSETDSDILIVRERDFSMVPKTATSPLRGVPRYDVEHAVTHPEDCFDSPQQVANLNEFSVDLRRRILQAWEYDIRAEMANENEGGPARRIDVNALDEIFAARELLEIKQSESGHEPATLERRSA